MSAMSCRLIYARADHRKLPDHNRNVARTLTKSVRKSLEVDTCRRAELVTEDIGACLETPKGTPSDIQEECLIVKGWYQHALGRQPHPSCTDLEKVS